jgi:hypothetical protein
MGCPSHCHHRGICFHDFYCVCDTGFSGYVQVNNTTLPDCSLPLKDIRPTGYQVNRFINIGFNILFIMAVVITLVAARKRYTERRNKKLNDQLENVTLLVAASKYEYIVLLDILFYLVLNTFVWIVDPDGMYYRLPGGVIYFEEGFALLVGIIYLTAVLMHWITFSRISARKIKQQEMLKRIRKDFNAEVTVEQIAKDTQKFDLFKWFALGIVLIIFCLDVVMVILQTMRNPAYFWWAIVFLTINCFFQLVLVVSLFYLFLSLFKRLTFSSVSM